MKKLVLMIIICLVLGGVSQAAVASQTSGKVLVQLRTFKAEVSQKDFEPFDRKGGDTPNLSLVIGCSSEFLFMGPYVQGYTFKWTCPEDPPEFVLQRGETLFILLVHSPRKGQNEVIAAWTFDSLPEATELSTLGGRSLNIDGVTPGGTSLNINARIMEVRDEVGSTGKEAAQES